MNLNPDVLKQIVDRRAYDFYRCYACHRLITSPEMDEGLHPAPGQSPRVCPCGSMRFSPSDLQWYDWLKPRVLYFAYLRVIGEA